MQGTIVFEKIWTAIHAKKKDGTRKYKYIILTGSSRSSKTHSILQSHYLKAFEKQRRISIWRETKKDTKDTVLADFKKALPHLENHEQLLFNKTESIYHFPNNSTIEICGGDDESKVHGFQGDVAHFNEPYNISKDTFDQIDMRTSEYVLIDWNPKKRHWIDDLSKQDNAIVIHSTFKDNPFCPEEQRIKILSYEPTPRNIQQKTADDYKWQVYGLGLKAEKPNRIYRNWQRMTLRDYENISYNEYFGLDFGKKSPTAMTGVKFNGVDEFYIRPMLYCPMDSMPNGLPSVLETMIKKSDVLVVDPADKESRLDLMRNGFNVIKASKGAGSVEGGISLVQKFKIYYVYEEVQGKDSIYDSFEFEYENYEWEIIKGVNLDRPKKVDDHYMDDVRYIITWLCRYLGVK